MPNRLATETSPYLQQHADNPVDWYPWGDEALERARREDKPILLSVGYSACHWCHVMAHEIFEDPEVAAVMNRLFVNVKVDREERPDIDQIYQRAHQMLAQRPGGWPLTMFLTPQGVPFFGGTYFPRSAAPWHARVSATCCERIAAIWREQRAEIERAERGGAATPSRAASRGDRGRREEFSADVDRGDAGRPARELRRAARRVRRRAEVPASHRPRAVPAQRRERRRDARRVAAHARACAEGGIYDQLGGGFCRYSDRRVLDHPALREDAVRQRTAARPARRRLACSRASRLFARVAARDGGLDHARDAVAAKAATTPRSTPTASARRASSTSGPARKLRSLLTPDEYAVLAAHYGLDQPPNFENRYWHLRVTAPASDESLLDSGTEKAFLRQGKPDAAGTRREGSRVLERARDPRHGACRARVLGRPEWIASARRALGFIRTAMWREGRLLATYKDARAHLKAYLDDYAFLLAATLELLQERFDAADLAFACKLADVLLEQFEDAEAGGFFFTARDHEQLVQRPKPPHDNATPSGNGGGGLGPRASCGNNRRGALRLAPRSATLELFSRRCATYPAGFAAMTIALEEAAPAAAHADPARRRRGLRAWQPSSCRHVPAGLMVLAHARRDPRPGARARQAAPSRAVSTHGYARR